MRNIFMKKIFALAAALLMLLSALSACADDKGDELPEDSTADEPLADMLVIAKTAAETQYRIIYADDSSDTVVSLARSMANEINSTYEGCLMFCSPAYAQWEDAPTDTLEILIGKTNRPESEELQATVTNDYSYAIRAFENGRIAICGANDQQLKKAIEYFLEQYIEDDTDGMLTVPKTLDLHEEESVQSRRWGLSVPAYNGGIYSSSIYNIGPGVTVAQDSELGRMQIVSNTERAEFDAYLTALTDSGYTQTARNESNGSLYVQYRNDTKNKTVYAYHIAALREAHIIDESLSVREPDFEYTYTPKAGESAAIYQYGMMYNRNGNGNCVGDPYPNNGMFYIIRLSDNKLILIDGGGEMQATEQATEALLGFMREITGKGADEVVDIAAIIFTHPHGDHKQFVDNLITNHSESINVERAMFNFAAFGYSGLTQLAATLKANFPNVKYLKPHTGQQIQLGDVTMDILITHEDFVNPDTGVSTITDENNTSTVIRFTVNGKSMLLMGDWGGGDVEPPEYAEAERRLLAMHIDESTGYNLLDCDIIQVAHHALNPYLEDVYLAVTAEYALFPCADVRAEHLAHPVQEENVRDILASGTEHLYFASRYTYCLNIAQDGTVTVAAELLRGADTGDDPDTPNVDSKGMAQEHLKEQDYVNETLKAYEPYYTPSEEELSNWALVHP